MKRFLFFLSFVSSIICSHYAISSDQPCNFDERLPGRQLLTAAIKGDKEKAEQLLKEDASLVNFLDFYGRTPLHMAISNNKFDVAHMLLDYGAPAGIADQSGSTPLMAAVFLPNDPVAALRLCRRLQKKGANLDHSDMHLNNALMLAALSCVYRYDSYGELFNFLIKNTSDLDQPAYEKSTALHYAAMNGSSDLVLRLLIEGAKSSTKNKNKKTAYDVAVQYGYKNIQELLSNPYLIAK